MSMEDDNKHDSVVQDLLERRVVLLDRRMTEESVSLVRNCLVKLQLQVFEPITLIIDSEGGNSDAALHLCDILSSVITVPVRGVVIGKCFSAATFVLLCCTERLCTPYSRFLIHSGANNPGKFTTGKSTSADLKQLAEEIKTSEKQVMKLYANRLTPVDWEGKNLSKKERRSYVKKLIRRGDQRFNSEMNAKEALHVGLVTDIVSGKLEIFE
jgi:ATP-dependent protease ClpP protease subunit